MVGNVGYKGACELIFEKFEVVFLDVVYFYFSSKGVTNVIPVESPISNWGQRWGTVWQCGITRAGIEITEGCWFNQQSSSILQLIL